MFMPYTITNNSINSGAVYAIASSADLSRGLVPEGTTLGGSVHDPVSPSLRTGHPIWITSRGYGLCGSVPYVPTVNGSFQLSQDAAMAKRSRGRKGFGSWSPRAADETSTLVTCSSNINDYRYNGVLDGESLSLFKPSLQPNLPLNLSQEWVWIQDPTSSKWCGLKTINGTASTLVCDLDYPKGYIFSAAKFTFLPLALPSVRLHSLVTRAPCGTSVALTCDADNEGRRLSYHEGLPYNEISPDRETQLPYANCLERNGPGCNKSLANRNAEVEKSIDEASISSTPIGALGPLGCGVWCSKEKGEEKAKFDVHFSLLLQTPSPEGLVSGAIVGFNTWTRPSDDSKSNDPLNLDFAEALKQCCVQATFPYVLECRMPATLQRSDKGYVVKGERGRRGDLSEGSRPEEVRAVDPVMPNECWFNIYVVDPSGKGIRNRGVEGGAKEGGKEGEIEDKEKKEEEGKKEKEKIEEEEQVGQGEVEVVKEKGRHLGKDQDDKLVELGAALPITNGSLVMLYSRGSGRYCSVSMDGSILCVSALPSNATRNLFRINLGPGLKPFAGLGMDSY
eukprot:CAMPEP_0175044428 /NCGR_PEP_ID=MMETSP0052_2-20121109/3796_1 /TAXON_ID=51329 ORGANISM="Polytomella parva, Strain SAG 63-3" /NCGR_SAMPLE_ID=MMETSP0052_2 /ASSEMBLY_ACC=CAM_ASM_000194 /LENGTH=563 /DNA_ID=CAMNT_0016307715 /DNA_START=404 /DNA_END=2095 /DNA_ORIENTATION=-